MARIVQTSTDELEVVDVDPVTLDLIENGLRNARYEMDEVLFRTALSPGIREQHDEFPLIADPSGKMVVGQFGLSIPDFLDGFDGDIGEGDVLLTSDPYACGAAISHANDWLVVTPIFVEGRLVGWASMFGHMSDVGGKTPSSMPTDGRPSMSAVAFAARMRACAPRGLDPPRTYWRTSSIASSDGCVAVTSCAA
jgi:N-methylhydantoinase B